VRTPAPAGRMFYRGFPEDGHDAPGSSRPTKIRHRTWFVKTVVGAHTAQPLAAPPLTDAAYPLRVACAPTCGIPTGTAAFAAPGQRSDLQVSGASRGEVGRAAAAVYHKAIDGGTLASTICYARATAAALGASRLGKHRSIEGAPRPGVLRGERIRAVPPQGG
jgi:hypothetical protein